MKTGTVVCTLCLAVATSMAVPHGNRGNKQAAVHLLAWAEETGGVILSETLLGKHQANGRMTSDPVVLSDFTSFLQQLSSQLTTLQSQTQADRHSTTGHRGRRNSLHLHSSPVLPPGSSLMMLDYNDILDILGEYTKGFVSTVYPIILSPLGSQHSLARRAVPTDPVSLLVQTILAQIQQMQDENLQ